MSKEEIINKECIKCFNEEVALKQALINVWNAAIQSAADEAKTTGSASAPVGTVYKYDPKSCRSYWVDKQSILKLKFDEK